MAITVNRTEETYCIDSQPIHSWTRTKTSSLHLLRIPLCKMSAVRSALPVGDLRYLFNFNSNLRQCFILQFCQKRIGLTKRLWLISCLSQMSPAENCNRVLWWALQQWPKAAHIRLYWNMTSEICRERNAKIAMTLVLHEFEN